MILFVADDHGGARCGAALHEGLRDHYDIAFFENDWTCFDAPGLLEACDFLMLSLIATMGGVAPPGAKAEGNVRSFVERGGKMLLVHGGSAAFWHWDWWRPIVGFRWVRDNDPDGFEASHHPNRPYRVTVAKSRHPLCSKLRDMDLPEDEIYMRLEQTCPAVVLMETTTDEGAFPQCYETMTPWGGTVLGFLPGHRREVIQHEAMLGNCRVLMDYLLSGAR